MGTPFRQLYKKTEDGKIVRRNRGLGDAVERIAQPIAKAIDSVAGTNIQECGGCKRRKEWLNKHTGQFTKLVNDDGENATT